MHVQKSLDGKTSVTLLITATTEDLEPIKNEVLKALSKNVSAPGFRKGKVPPQVAEKHLDQANYQQQFLDEAMTQLYVKACEMEDVRPVTQPQVSIKKFVPFTELEYEVKTEIVGEIKLGKYKGLKSSVKGRAVTEEDVKKVMSDLQTRMSERKEVEAKAKNGDEVIMDFSGKDEDGKPISGADGKDYPLLLGSNAFIPGFEDNLIGLKSGDEKTFELTFPKDYGVKALASKKVTFTVNIKKVNQLQKPELTDEFASSVGPFKSLKELENDVKGQLEQEAFNELTRLRQNDLLEQIDKASSVELPQSLIDQQATYELEDLKRNLMYRGQTYEEFLESEGKTDEEYKKDVLNVQAERQVKIAMLLSEIAKTENIEVTPEELEVQMQMLKTQYTDPQMQAELMKPSARQDIASRLLSQKVVNFIEQESV